MTYTRPLGLCNIIAREEIVENPPFLGLQSLEMHRELHSSDQYDEWRCAQGTQRHVALAITMPFYQLVTSYIARHERIPLNLAQRERFDLPPLKMYNAT